MPKKKNGINILDGLKSVNKRQSNHKKEKFGYNIGKNFFTPDKPKSKKRKGK